MGYTKVKAQKCLLKATNQTEPKGFTSIRHPGWFFSRAGDIYTQKTKTKLEILLSYWICNGCICKWVKIVVCNHNGINKCLWAWALSPCTHTEKLKDSSIANL